MLRLWWPSESEYVSILCDQIRNRSLELCLASGGMGCGLRQLCKMAYKCRKLNYLIKRKILKIFSSEKGGMINPLQKIILSNILCVLTTKNSHHTLLYYCEGSFCLRWPLFAYPNHNLQATLINPLYIYSYTYTHTYTHAYKYILSTCSFREPWLTKLSHIASLKERYENLSRPYILQSLYLCYLLNKTEVRRQYVGNTLLYRHKIRWP